MDPALLEFVSGDQVDLQAIPVYHSFGRGCWKELAEKVHLPRDALESAMEQQSSRVRDPVFLPSLPTQLGSQHGSSVKTAHGTKSSDSGSVGDCHQWPTPRESTGGSKSRAPTHDSKDSLSMERPRTSSDTPSPVVLPCESTSENSECSLELSSMQDDQLSPDLLLDWPLDTSTICFMNLPASITSKELQQAVEPFGGVTHCTVLPVSHPSKLATAYVRMEKRSACDWVISCFNGNPFNDSTQELLVFFCKPCS